ncbi:hypothetical protein Drose_25770 [Dactylosporangium roseum]|uniref:Outer membrane channel protein CpnT-like N-terminal domain-containing protein n=1 Tax=Dactylosporangium roseum TaxID=47989 RepID=A0ABY5Z187_9ACTN|nr:hypothetical protein [Dactylosporangium roseum]UWZ34617.1 hypothetical protein Drose_25770 [Dactylosporangium roseum]
MGIQRPDLGFWDWVWDAVTLVAGGSTWPKTDEDSIRAYGEEFVRLVEVLMAAQGAFRPTVAELQELWRGVSGAEFQRHWDYKLNTVLPKLIEGSKQVSTGANEAALAIEHEKYQILISVLICCAELAVILISSFFTGGLSWSAAPGVIAAARAVVLQAYRLLLGQLERGVLRALAREALFEGLQEFATDLTAQSLQIAEGNRTGLDGNSLATSMKWGAFGGLVGQGLGVGLGGARNLADGVENAVGRRVAGGAVDGVHGQATDALTNFVANGVENGEWDAVPDDLGGAAGRFALGVGAEAVRERISDVGHTALGNLLGADAPVAPAPLSAPAAPPSSALGKDTGGARNPVGDGAAAGGGRPSAGDGVNGGTRTSTADNPVGRPSDQGVDRQPHPNVDSPTRTAAEPPDDARQADRTVPDAPTVDARPGNPTPPDLTGVPLANPNGLPGAGDSAASGTAADPALGAGPHPSVVGPIGAEPGAASGPPAVSVTGPETSLSGPPSVPAPELVPGGSALVEFSGRPSDYPAVPVTGPVGVPVDATTSIDQHAAPASAVSTPAGPHTTVIGAVPVQSVTVSGGGGGPVTPPRSAGRGGDPPQGTVPRGGGASSGAGDPGDPAGPDGPANGEAGGPAGPGVDPEVQRAHEIVAAVLGTAVTFERVSSGVEHHGTVDRALAAKALGRLRNYVLPRVRDLADLALQPAVDIDALRRGSDWVERALGEVYYRQGDVLRDQFMEHRRAASRIGLTHTNVGAVGAALTLLAEPDAPRVPLADRVEAGRIALGRERTALLTAATTTSATVDDWHRTLTAVGAAEQSLHNLLHTVQPALEVLAAANASLAVADERLRAAVVTFDRAGQYGVVDAASRRAEVETRLAVLRDAVRLGLDARRIELTTVGQAPDASGLAALDHLRRKLDAGVSIVDRTVRAADKALRALEQAATSVTAAASLPSGAGAAAGPAVELAGAVVAQRHRLSDGVAGLLASLPAELAGGSDGAHQHAVETLDRALASFERVRTNLAGAVAVAQGEVFRQEDLPRVLNAAIAQVRFANTTVSRQGPSTVRFTFKQRVNVLGRSNAERHETHQVEIRVAQLPAGTDLRLRMPTRAELRNPEAVPAAVLEISPRLTTDETSLARLLADSLIKAGDQLHPQTRAARRAELLTADRTPGRSTPFSRGDSVRWQRLVGLVSRPSIGQRNPPGPAAVSAAVVRQLEAMGLLSDQAHMARRRTALRGRLRPDESHRVIALRMLDTRADADPDKVLAAVGTALDAAGRASVDDPGATVLGATLTGTDLTGAEPTGTATVRLRPEPRGPEEIRQLPVILEAGTPGVAVRLVHEGGAWRLRVRRDASDAAIVLETAGALAELAARTSGLPEAEVLAAKVERHLVGITALRSLATPVERVAVDHLVADLEHRLRRLGAPAQQEVEKVAEAAAAFRMGDKRARGPLGRTAAAGRAAKRGLVGPRDSANTSLLFHLLRRGSSAVGATLYAADTNPPAGRSPSQTLMTALRSALRDPVQGASDKKAAAVAAGAAKPARLAKPGTTARVKLTAPPGDASIAENLAKRVIGAETGAFASLIPLAFKSPDDYAYGQFAKALLAVEVVIGETATSALGQAGVDYRQDPAERTADNRAKHEASLSPDKLRNDAAKSAGIVAAELRERLARMRRAGIRLGGQERMQLLQEVAHARASLTAALAAMNVEVNDKVFDMVRRRERLNPILRASRAAGLVLPGSAPGVMSYTHAARGYFPGGPTWMDNALRVGSQQTLSGVQSVALQALTKALAVRVGPLALPFTAANVVTNVGFGVGYGMGWSRLKLEEAADQHAVEAWDARNAARDSLRKLDAVERLAYGWDPAETSTPQWPRRAKILHKLLKGDTKKAYARIQDDKAAGRPKPVHWWSQLVFKHGSGTVGRLAGVGLAGGLLGSPALAFAMVLGSLKLAASMAMETPMRVWTPAFKRVKELNDLRIDAATKTMTIVELARYAADLGDDVNARTSEITAAPTPYPRAAGDFRLHRRTGQLGREMRDLTVGLNPLSHPAPALRPGPNRPGEVRLTLADRRHLNVVHDRLRDLARAALTTRDRPLALDPELIRRDLLARLGDLGLLPDPADDAGARAATEQRWEAAKRYLRTRHVPGPGDLGAALRDLIDLRANGPDDPSLTEGLRAAWRAALDADAVRGGLAKALQKLADAGTIANTGRRLRMVELVGKDTVRITVRGVPPVRTHITVEAAYPAQGAGAELRPASAQDSRHRLVIAPDLLGDPAWLAQTLRRVLDEVRTTGGTVGSGITDIPRPDPPSGRSGPPSGPPPAPGAPSGAPPAPGAASTGQPGATTAAPVAPVSAVIAGLRGDPVIATPGAVTAGVPSGAAPSGAGGGQGQPPAGGGGAGAQPGSPDDPGRPDGFVPRQVANTPEQAALVAAAVRAALKVARSRIRQVLDPKHTRVDSLFVSVANKNPGPVRTDGTVVFTPRHGRPVAVTVRIDPRLSGETVRTEVPADGVARAAIRGNPEAVVSISADLTAPRHAGLLSDHLLGAMEHARQSHQRGAEVVHRAAPTATPNRWSGLSARDLGRLAALDAAMARRDTDAMVLHLGDMGLLTDQAGARERLPLLADRVGVGEGQRLLARLLFGTRSAPDAAAVLDTLCRALDRAVDDYAEGKVDAAGVLDPAAPDPHVTVSVNGRTLRIPLEVAPPGNRDFAVRLVVDDSAPHQYRIQLRQDASDPAIAVETAGVLAELGDRVRLRGRYGQSGDEVRIAARSAVNARLEVLRDLYDGKSFNWRQRVFLSPSVGERALVVQEIAARGLHDLRNAVEHRSFFDKLEGRSGRAGHRPGASPPMAAPRPSPRLWWPHEFRRWFSGLGGAANTIGIGLEFGRDPTLIATSVAAGLLGSGVGQAWADAVLGSRLPSATLRTAGELGPKEPDRRVDPQDNTPLSANVTKRVPYAVVSSGVTVAVLASGNVVRAAVGGAITAAASLGQAFLDKFADPYEKNAVQLRKRLEALEPDSRRNEAARALRYHAEALAERLSQPDGETRAALEDTLRKIRAFRDATEIEVQSKISDMERSRRLFSTMSWVWDDTAGLRTGETYTMVHLPSGNAGAWYNEARVGGQQAIMQVPSALLGMSPLNFANLLAAGGRGALYGKLWTVLSGQQAQARAALDAWDALHHLKEAEGIVAGMLDPGTVGPREAREAASSAREQKRHDDAIDRPRTESRIHQANKHLLGFVGSIAGASVFFPFWHPGLAVVYVAGQAGYTLAYAIGEGVQRIRPGYSERAHIDGELLGKARRLPYTTVERAQEMAMLAEVARTAQEDIKPMPVPERRGLAAAHGITQADLRKGADAVAGLRHPMRSPVLRPGANDAGELVLSSADHATVDGLFHRVEEIEQATAGGRRPVGLVPRVLLGELRLYLERHGLVALTEGEAAAGAARARWEAVKASMTRRHGLDLDSLDVLRTLRRPEATWPDRVGIRDRLVVGAPDARTPGTADLTEVKAWLADRRRRDPLQLPLLTALDRVEGPAWPGATTVRLGSPPGLLRVSTPDGDFSIRVRVLDPGAGDIVAELRPAADTFGRAVIGADTYEPHQLFVDAAVLGDRQRFARVLDNAVRYLADAAPDRLNRLALPDPGQLVMYRADPPAPGGGGAGHGAPGAR